LPVGGGVRGSDEGQGEGWRDGRGQSDGQGSRKQTFYNSKNFKILEDFFDFGIFYKLIVKYYLEY
jgi:hypothetical protein